jgi:hypothetical protein
MPLFRMKKQSFPALVPAADAPSLPLHKGFLATTRGGRVPRAGHALFLDPPPGAVQLIGRGKAGSAIRPANPSSPNWSRPDSHRSTQVRQSVILLLRIKILGQIPGGAGRDGEPRPSRKQKRPVSPATSFSAATLQQFVSLKRGLLVT